MRAKRKKNSRQRGSKTHGWGAMKKHRGAGNRGGRGHAGTGKRSDCKKPSVWAIKDFYGRKGFTPRTKKIIVSCNIEQLERNYKDLIKEKKIKEENNIAIIDLNIIGVIKLLGKGNPTRKWNVTVQQASEAAIKKIAETGGAVNTRGIVNGMEGHTAKSS